MAAYTLLSQTDHVFRQDNRINKIFLFPVNQQSPNSVKTYNYILIRSGFSKVLHQNYFL